MLNEVLLVDVQKYQCIRYQTALTASAVSDYSLQIETTYTYIPLPIILGNTQGSAPRCHITKPLAPRGSRQSLQRRYAKRVQRVAKQKQRIIYQSQKLRSTRIDAVFQVIIYLNAQEKG